MPKLAPAVIEDVVDIHNTLDQLLGLTSVLSMHAVNFDMHVDERERYLQDYGHRVVGPPQDAELTIQFRAPHELAAAAMTFWQTLHSDPDAPSIDTILERVRSIVYNMQQVDAHIDGQNMVIALLREAVEAVVTTIDHVKEHPDALAFARFYQLRPQLSNVLAEPLATRAHEYVKTVAAALKEKRADIAVELLSKTDELA